MSAPLAWRVFRPLSTQPRNWVTTRHGFNWENQTVYKLGVQYGVNNRLQVRAGYNYGKTPIPDDMVTFNLLAPAPWEHHYSLGFTYRANENLEVTAPICMQLPTANRIVARHRQLRLVQYAPEHVWRDLWLGTGTGPGALEDTANPNGAHQLRRLVCRSELRAIENTATQAIARTLAPRGGRFTQAISSTSTSASKAAMRTLTT